jgi:hypothetical protein
MTPKVAPDEPLTPFRLAHLSMIQGIILRLSGFSAGAKNFCITILAAVIGIAFQHRLPLLYLAAAFVIIVFAALDTYYLSQERRFRKFYEEVAARPMSDARELGMAPAKLSVTNYVKGTWSFSTGGFYLLLLIVAGALLSIAYGRFDENQLGGAGGVVGASERSGDTANIGGGKGIVGNIIKTDANFNTAELVGPGGNSASPRPVRRASADAGRPVRSAATPAASGSVEPVR